MHAFVHLFGLFLEQAPLTLGIQLINAFEHLFNPILLFFFFVQLNTFYSRTEHITPCLVH